jgi:predicted nucleotidyltransferase
MLERLLEKIALALEECGIPYMVIGGQAVLVYGEPRLTRDIDVTMGVGPDRLGEVLDLVKEQGWQVLVQEPEEFVRRTMVLPCLDRETRLRIDLMFSYSEYERQALRRVQCVPIGNAQVRFASIEDLVIHKIIAGRPRDLEDVRGVLLKNPTCQVEYIRQWLQEFDRSLGATYLAEFEDMNKPSG